MNLAGLLLAASDLNSNSLVGFLVVVVLVLLAIALLIYIVRR